MLSVDCTCLITNWIVTRWFEFCECSLCHDIKSQCSHTHVSAMFYIQSRFWWDESGSCIYMIYMNSFLINIYIDAWVFFLLFQVNCCVMIPISLLSFILAWMHIPCLINSSSFSMALYAWAYTNAYLYACSLYMLLPTYIIYAFMPWRLVAYMWSVRTWFVCVLYVSISMTMGCLFIWPYTFLDDHYPLFMVPSELFAHKFFCLAYANIWDGYFAYLPYCLFVSAYICNGQAFWSHISMHHLQLTAMTF